MTVCCREWSYSLWHFPEYLENVYGYLIVLVPKFMIFRVTSSFFITIIKYYGFFCVESDTKYLKISAVTTVVPVYLQT